MKANHKGTIFPAGAESITKAAEIIRRGGVVAFPTETVYGLGANALDPVAVAKIFEIKNRPRFDPLIVHLNNRDELYGYTRHVYPVVEKLIKQFWPGPLTLVLPKNNIIPDIVTAGLDSFAVRMPANGTALELIKEAGCPLAAPSANPFGYLSPTRAAHVYEQLGNKVPMIIDGGECSVGIESTIIKVLEDHLHLLRPGGLPLEDIEKVAGEIVQNGINKNISLAPGLTEHHYSPKAELKIITGPGQIKTGQFKTGLLAFSEYPQVKGIDVIEILSPEKNLTLAASRFFSCLHRLDSAGCDIIYAEKLPETGLGLAMMNRLIKAQGN